MKVSLLSNRTLTVQYVCGSPKEQIKGYKSYVYLSIRLYILKRILYIM
jgi:hypothetical protein